MTDKKKKGIEKKEKENIKRQNLKRMEQDVTVSWRTFALK